MKFQASQFRNNLRFWVNRDYDFNHPESLITDYY